MSDVRKLFSLVKMKKHFKPSVDSLVFRLHYRYSVYLWLAAALLSSTYGTLGSGGKMGSKNIDCLVEKQDEKSQLRTVAESYCYISGTHTVSRLHYGEIGVDNVYPGVGPHQAKDDLINHAYYQWVPFVLVAQAALFYLPHLVWKSLEGGLFRCVIQNLSVRDYLSEGKKTNKKRLECYSDKETEFESLSTYFTDYMPRHRGWALKFLLCEASNVLVTIVTFWLTNVFLGGKFLTYGFDVVTVTNMDSGNHTDQASLLFPTMGICNFTMYGPSGTVVLRNFICLLPTNITNEKIFIVLWFWLVILVIVGVLWMLFRLLLICKTTRNELFMLQSSHFHALSTSPATSTTDTSISSTTSRRNNRAAQLRSVLTQCDLDQYLLLQQLSDSMDQVFFSQLVRHLALHFSSNGSKSSSTDSGVLDDTAPATAPTAGAELDSAGDTDTEESASLRNLRHMDTLDIAAAKTYAAAAADKTSSDY